MPSIKVKDGKTSNPIATKLILIGLKDFEIKLEQAKVVTTKQAFCVVSLGEYYLNNKDQHGNPDQFIEYILNNFTHVNLDTQKGIIAGAEIHKRLLNKLEKFIQAHILMDWHRKHGILKDL